MRRHLLNIGCSSAIFLTAVALVTLLARAPFGEIYATIAGRAENDRTAAITLLGAIKPSVEVDVAIKKDARYVILRIDDAKATDVTIMLPSAWHLEEVLYAHASDVKNNQGDRETTYFLTLIDGKIELRFKAESPFDSISFSDDAANPALFTLTVIDLAGETVKKEVKIVERSAIVRL